MNLKRVIKRPIVTEKTSQEEGFSGYCFEVDKTANKQQIRTAIETFFKVNVISIKTVVVKGKKRRNLRTKKVKMGSNWKKATVQLKKGEKLDLWPIAEEEVKSKVAKKDKNEQKT